MKIILGDWLTNAGILGYLRLRQLAGKGLPDLSKEYIEITPSDLDGFTDWYFTHVLMRKAEGVFRLGSVRSDLRLKLDNKQFTEIRSKLDKLEKNSLQKINQDYNNFDSTLHSVVKEINMFEEKVVSLLETELKEYSTFTPKDAEVLKGKIKESISDYVRELQDKNLKFIQIHLSSFYKNKNVIANYASRATKNSFQELYVKPALELLNSPAAPSEGFSCKFCRYNRVMLNDFDDGNSVFSEGMFSTTGLTMKFRNFFYNMQPDVFVCDVCELLLISAWAGFTEIPYRYRDRLGSKIIGTNYVFVNLPTLELLWEESNKIQGLYEQDNEELQGTIYQDIIEDIFLSKQRMKAKWTLQNILFIEIKTTSQKHADRPDFRYFHIGEDIARLFTDEKEYVTNALKKITGMINLGNSLEVNLRRNVVARILEHDSLFPLCHSLVLSHLDNGDTYSLRNVFNITLISCIRASIAGGNEHIEVRPLLESKQIYGILKSIQNEGSDFGSIDYDVRRRKSYSLMSMIRNGRVEDFCDVLMKIYMSQNKPVPDSIIGFLNKEDEIGFQARAYAFMSGFLSSHTLGNQQG
jgi:CRISPR-associated protein Cas8b1/Cst1 subtype I-B